MSLKIYNVLSHKKEEFIPINDGIVNMYACGITVSDNAHIGHAYQATVFDVIRKYLEYSGYKVNYVRNYTDVDDKIIIKARELNIDPKEYAKILIDKTDSELDTLGVLKPTVMAKATESVEDMIGFIEKLIEKGKAYHDGSGNVYFRVSSFDNYGKFSNRVIEESLVGVRKDVEPGKEEDQDFALWKAALNDEIFWESPWGLGRPGWHIECSAMSMRYLGEQLDIHGGGKDLLFPHHENEIAQSESLTGKQFSKYWIHNGLVKINGQKMSKSLNNGILIEDLIKTYNTDVIRITLLQNSYRSDLNLLTGMFEQNESKIYNMYKLFNQIDQLSGSTINEEFYNRVNNEFKETMDNDFNTSVAIANLLVYIDEMTKIYESKNNLEMLSDMKKTIIKVYYVLGLLQQNPEVVVVDIKNKYLSKNNISEVEILEKIEERKKLKEEKQYDKADNVRSELLNKHIILKDSRDKTDWDIEFNI